MTLRKHTCLILAALVVAGCGDKETRAARKKERAANPTFMFFNYREEIVSEQYHVPDMKSEATAAYLKKVLKGVPNVNPRAPNPYPGVPGYVDSEHDLSKHTLTVRYKSSTARKMNFEEAIATAGFSVNNRPAHSNATIPKGVK